MEKEKETVKAKRLKQSWNGRNGYDIYFVSITNREKAMNFVKENFEYRPMCGDNIDYVRKVHIGEDFFGYHVDSPGCIVKVNKWSCS